MLLLNIDQACCTQNLDLACVLLDLDWACVLLLDFGRASFCFARGAAGLVLVRSPDWSRIVRFQILIVLFLPRQIWVEPSGCSETKRKLGI